MQLFYYKYQILESGVITSYKGLTANAAFQPTLSSGQILVPGSFSIEGLNVPLTSPLWAGQTFISTGSGSTDIFDYQIPGDRLLQTATLYVDPETSMSFAADHLGVVVIDKDNILGFGADYIVRTAIQNLFVHKGIIVEFEATSPTALLNGLYLRITYVAGEASPAVKFSVMYKWRI